jgi:hypothetical protein
MSRFAKLVLAGSLALGSVGAIAPIASARPPVVIVRGGFGFGPAFYGPGWYGGGWYGAGAYGYASGQRFGSVKFDTRAKSAGVYVDGGYAGTVGELKTFHLRPGSHDIELRTPDGQTFFQERINVVAGKTLKLTPNA